MQQLNPTIRRDTLYNICMCRVQQSILYIRVTAACIRIYTIRHYVPSNGNSEPRAVLREL